jgi:hypothetical protein
VNPAGKPGKTGSLFTATGFSGGGVKNLLGKLTYEDQDNVNMEALGGVDGEVIATQLNIFAQGDCEGFEDGLEYLSTY